MTHPTPTTLPRVVVLSEALTDLIRVDGDNWQAKTGGSGWNVARVISTLRIPAAFAGAISQDCFGDALWQHSMQAGLDMRFLQRFALSPLLAAVYQSQPPAYFFIGENSADLAFDPNTLPKGWMQACEWAHFGGISLAREPLASRLLSVAQQLKAANCRISYDPNFRVLMDERYDSMLASMMRVADLVKVSDEDLRGLFRTDDVDHGLAQLRALNPQAVVMLTRGEEGASMFSNQGVIHAKPPRVQVVDTVGAGDASIGGLLVSLLQQPATDWQATDWATHLRFAMATAAAACQHAGATPPQLAAVEAILGQVG